MPELDLISSKCYHNKIAKGQTLSYDGKEKQMGEVKTALERALEKVKDIKGLSEEEKIEIKEREKVKETLASFFKGDIKREEVVNRLKGIRNQLIIEAQINLADMIRLSSPEEEYNQKRDVLISLEMVKDSGNIIAVEEALNVIKGIQKEYNDLKERAIKEFRTAIEQNPHLRMRQVRLPDGRLVQAALGVDEALQERLTEFFDEHDERYERMLSRALERLKAEFK